MSVGPRMLRSPRRPVHQRAQPAVSRKGDRLLTLFMGPFKGVTISSYKDSILGALMMRIGSVVLNLALWLGPAPS